MEREFVAWLTKRFPPDARVPCGIGDDAAVLAPLASGQLVAAVDTITDLVDFHLDQTSPRAIGHKALGVNLSDLAAMAATPVAFLASCVLPQRVSAKRTTDTLAREIYEGMALLADRYDLPLAGGDTNTWDGPLVLSITVFGQTAPQGPLLRSGAQPGDALLVTGPVGGSLVGRHLLVTPRVHEASELHARYPLHAGIDISDGLALDAARLAEASQCGVELDLAAIPIHPDAHLMAAQSGRTPLAHALSDGEDFELLLAVPPAEAQQIVANPPAGLRISHIGRFITDKGLWQSEAVGRRSRLEPTGYLHSGDQG